MMTQNGFVEMMSNVLGATGKKDADINAAAYRRQLGNVKEFIDEDGLKASTLLTQESPLPQNIMSYLYKHMSNFSSQRLRQEAPQEPKFFVEDYDEEKKEIRQKNMSKIMDLGKKCLHKEISTKTMYEEFDKIGEGWFKANIKYPGGYVTIDVRTQKEYSVQGEREMWRKLEDEENEPVERSEDLIGNVVAFLPKH